MKRVSKFFFMTIGLVLSGQVADKIFAEETTAEKVQNKSDEVKTHSKKAGRRVKKEVRDATGNHSTKEDVKDDLKSTGDSIGDSAKKVKRKVD